MIRATYQKRLAGMIAGIRPSAAHVYGASPRTPVDNLTDEGIAAWQGCLRILASDMADADELTYAEQFTATWVTDELERDACRWSDASSLLELLALSLGPMSLDPSHLRPNSFWLAWERNLADYRRRLIAGRATFSGDTVDLANHCADLVLEHDGPVDLQLMLCEIADFDAPVTHRPEVFRPLTDPMERLQLSALMAAAYDPAAAADCEARNRALFTPPVVSTPNNSCTREQRV